MKTYQYFSAGFNCNVSLTYFKGLLKSVDIEEFEARDDINRAYFIIREEDFIRNCTQNKIKFIEVSKEITFEMFWDKYEYKVGKHEAEEQWKKLSKLDRAEAFYFIPRYNARLKSETVSRRHPSTYLHKKTWR